MALESRWKQPLEQIVGDGFRIQMEADDKPDLEKDHQLLAQEGYDTFRFDRQLSKDSWTAIDVRSLLAWFQLSHGLWFIS